MLRRRPLRRHAAARRRLGARLRPRRDRGRRRPADDHRHEEQPAARHPQGQRLPDGAAADRRLQARRAREPAGAAAGGRHRRRPDRRSTRPPSCWPTTRCRSRRRSTATRRSWRRIGDDERSPHASTPRSAASSTSSSHTAAPSAAERARAAAAGEAPNFAPLVRQWGGVTIAYRKRLQDSPAYRLNHEEVIKALEEGITFAENLDPVEAVPDEFGHAARPWSSTGGGSAALVEAAGAHRPRRRRHVRRTSPTRRNTRARSRSTRSGKFFKAHHASTRTPAGVRTLVDGRAGLLHVVRHATGASSPTTATTIPATPATSSRRWPRRKRRLPARRARSSTRARDARPGSPAGARRRVAAPWSRASTTNCWPASSEVEPSHADDRRGHRQGAGRRAHTSSPASSTACRTSSAQRARDDRRPRVAADGGPRAHRRLGRQGAGPARR